MLRDRKEDPTEVSSTVKTKLFTRQPTVENFITSRGFSKCFQPSSEISTVPAFSALGLLHS